MELTLSQKNILQKDRQFWMLAILLLAGIAFSLLLRDGQKQYGAVSFGAFPSFQAVDAKGNIFDQHRLHGQLTAVIISNEFVSLEILNYLQKISQVTGMGKKILKNLVVSNASVGVSSKWIEYLSASDEQYKQLIQWNKNNGISGVILVDQNGIVRGFFDLTDKLGRINFEGAVKGIL